MLDFTKGGRVRPSGEESNVGRIPVISGKGQFPAADQNFARNTVEMQFNYQLDYSGTPQVVDTYQADPDSVFYTNSALDFTLVRLSPKYRNLIRRVGSEAISPQEEIYGFAGEEASALGSAFSSTVSPYTIRFPYTVPFRIRWDAGSTWGHLQLRPSVSYALDQRVNIIQHPKGRRKELAIHQNTITNIYTSRIRYKTDTEPGSSGSPVFNNGWDLIAIHHAAGEKDPITGAWVNNEGMRIDKIVADLRNHYQGSTTGAQILAELGI